MVAGASSARDPIPVIGIGSSAGGIAPLKKLFQLMPADLGAAFVLIPHLSPDHESQIAEIVGNSTALPVTTVTTRCTLESNHIYVIPPGAYLTLEGDELIAAEPDHPRGHRRPVDTFFATLAESKGPRAIAIVLSGMDANGTAALREVKAEGGFVIVQHPDEAEFASMPAAALATGLVDLALPIAEIPEAIRRMLDHPYIEAGEYGPLLSEGQLDMVLQHMQMEHGQDFWNYKRPTVRRRIVRRMSLNNHADGKSYLEGLLKDGDEAAKLGRDLLINVTGFFRDPVAWEVLEHKALAPLVHAHSPREEVRIWCAGCATGEEAYSIGMLLAESMEREGKPLDVKIFATDTAAHALEVARNGVYSQAALASLSPERVERFFDRHEDQFRVKKPLRNMVVFAEQNLLRDPPFTRIDLLICRNLMIYLNAETQQSLIAIMHFALKREGCLFLGTAEQSSHGRADLFEPVDGTWRIYKRRGEARPDLVDVPLKSHGAPRWREGLVRPPKRQGPEIARESLLEAFAPPSVLIDRELRVLYFHGATEKYLKPPRGEPTNDLTDYCDGALSSRIRGMVHQAGRRMEQIAGELPMDGGTLRLTVTPVRYGPAPVDELFPQHFAVAFAAVERPVAKAGADGEPMTPDEDLAAENMRLRTELRDTIEQMHGTNEELKASNEEIMSINEELRSSNEEMETSKEELQSLNEEMNTINSQLNEKVAELEFQTNDLNNLLNSSNVATIFLDNGLKIRWFSPAMQGLLKLVPGDVGRPIDAFAHIFERDGFVEAAGTVLRKLTSYNGENDCARWQSLRMPHPALPGGGPHRRRGADLHGCDAAVEGERDGGDRAILCRGDRRDCAPSASGARQRPQARECE